MQVLIACEYSGRERDAFIDAGHEAWSADLLPGEGKYRRRHFQGNVLPLLREPWDLVIAHPPCTYLTALSAQWLVQSGRREKLHASAEFFKACLNANAPRVAVENPTMLKYARRILSEPAQCIQPWQFGDPYTKRTCLWLRGLPPLIPSHARVSRDVTTEPTYPYVFDDDIRPWVFGGMGGSARKSGKTAQDRSLALLAHHKALGQSGR